MSGQFYIGFYWGLFVGMIYVVARAGSDVEWTPIFGSLNGTILTASVCALFGFALPEMVAAGLQVLQMCRTRRK